jgi:Zn-dependent peptidase ImmA (M78 family)/transcriptional regulator with XRE-family HTH domain
MIGKRLKRAREATGLSLRDLEEVMNKEVSAQAIGKYERDEMMPGSTILLGLAKALTVTPEYLLSTREIELTGVDFRKGPQAGVKEERAVEAAILDHVERYMELEELMPNADTAWIPLDRAEFMIDRVDDAERAAVELRTLWELGIAPIQNMSELLEGKGIKVVSIGMPVNVSGSKAFVHMQGESSAPIVVVNDNHNGERQRFTLAHELAHLVLSFTDNFDGKDQEKAADRFAGAFLMAKDLLMELLGGVRTSISLGELADLKKIFKVSISSLVVRCAQVGAITKTLYGRLFGHIKALGWNDLGSSEPGGIEKEKPQRMERLCMRAVSEEAISKSKGAALLKITIEAMDDLLYAKAA